MNKRYLVILFLLMLLISGCVVPYVPEINDKDEIIVVQGLITDQPGPNIIKLSKSSPLWTRESLASFSGCAVWITDDLDGLYTLKETLIPGTYITDQSKFRGVIGRTYVLHIKTTKGLGRLSYESLPMKMNPVPPIDSIYYVKEEFNSHGRTVEGCTIFLSTHDPGNNCKYYKWSYSETWEFHVPFKGPYQVCWKSNDSREMIIKNANILSENKISGEPLLTIADPVERLSVKYSILVNQYSMNEDEYIYWERFRNMSEQTGSLYDIIPAAIPNNIYCVENPSEKTLGYFSVSAFTSNRIFIKDTFAGFNGTFEKCLSDTVFTTRPDTLDRSGRYLYIIEDHSKEVPPAVIFTADINCVDCRSRGTSFKPSFWDDDKIPGKKR
jgi:hypothetical protein